MMDTTALRRCVCDGMLQRMPLSMLSFQSYTVIRVYILIIEWLLRYCRDAAIAHIHRYAERGWTKRSCIVLCANLIQLWAFVSSFYFNWRTKWHFFDSEFSIFYQFLNFFFLQYFFWESLKFILTSMRGRWYALICVYELMRLYILEWPMVVIHPFQAHMKLLYFCHMIS